MAALIVIAFAAPMLGSAFATRPTPAPTPSTSAETPTIPVEIQEPTSASEPSDPAAGAPRALPPGSWILVLESLSKRDWTPAQAHDVAAGLARGGRSPFVIDSDAHAGLNPGYLVIVVGPFASRSAATNTCASLGRQVDGSCYPRQA